MTLAELAVTAAFWGALAACVVLPRTTVRHRSVTLFRAFFPSWRLFEDVGPLPCLFHRSSPSHVEDAWSEWQETLPHRPRGLCALLLDAEGNGRFASGSVVDQLVQSLDEASLDLDAFEGSVPYQLVCALVRERVAELGPKGSRRCQFVVVTEAARSPDDVEECHLLSSVFHLGEP